MPFADAKYPPPTALSLTDQDIEVIRDGLGLAADELQRELESWVHWDEGEEEAAGQRLSVIDAMFQRIDTYLQLKKGRPPYA